MQRASVVGMPSPDPGGSYSQQFKAMRFSYHIEGGPAAAPHIRAGKCNVQCNVQCYAMRERAGGGAEGLGGGERKAGLEGGGVNFCNCIREGGGERRSLHRFGRPAASRGSDV